MFDVLLVIFVLLFFGWAGPAFSERFCQGKPNQSKKEKTKDENEEKNWPMILRALDASVPLHDLLGDASGDKGAYKLWLIVHALQEQELNRSRTWVLWEEGEIMGFLTTQLGSFGDDAKGAFFQVKWIVLKKFQKQEYEKKILLKCLHQSEELLNLTAFKGILAYAMDDNVKFFTQWGFMHIHGSEVFLKSDQIQATIHKLSEF